MSPIRLGVIGLSATNASSWAAFALVPPLLTSPLNAEYEIKALCTSSEESARTTADKYSALVGHPIKAYYGDSGITDLANDPEVDLVVVAIRSLSHKKAVLPAIEAGKNFFVEWPAGNGLQETEEIAKAAKEKGVRSFVGTQGRNSFVLEKVKEIISSGKIGRVISTTAVISFTSERQIWGPKIQAGYEVAINKAIGSSFLEIIGGHFISSLLYALNCTTFSSVSATTNITFPFPQIVTRTGEPTGNTASSTTADQISFSGILKETGAIASVSLGSGHKSVPGQNGLTWIINGEDGVIKLESPDSTIQMIDPVLTVNGEVVQAAPAGADAESPQLSAPGNEGNIARGWANYTRGSGYTTIEDALGAKRVVDAVLRSAAEGVRVDLA